MRTCLIKPNSKKSQYKDVINLSAIEPPIWMSLLANCYSEPLLIDAEAEDLTHLDVYERLREAKIDNVIILCTGSHPSANVQQKEIGEEWNNFFVGAGFKTEIYDYLPFDPISVGQPRWDLLPMDKYRAHNWQCWSGRNRNNYGALFTTISCCFQCKFCQIKDFYRSSYKKRNVDEAIQDLYIQFSKYNIRNFKMMDELFVIDNRHTNEFCDKVISNNFGKYINIWAYARIDTVNEKLLQKLALSGVRWLAYGIESGNFDIRKEMQKGAFTNDKIRDIIKMTKECGISVVGNYMFGFWNDNLDTMKETLDFAIDLNCEYSNFYCTVAYPGSELYWFMKNKGIKLPEHSEEYAQMSPKFNPLPTKYLTNKQVLKFRDESFQTYFTNSVYLNYMRSRFNIDTRNEIEKMTKIKLERDILK